MDSQSGGYEIDSIRRLTPVLFAAFVFVFMIALVGYGQEAPSATTSTVQVPAGQKLEMKSHSRPAGRQYFRPKYRRGGLQRLLANNPEVKKKSNPFRGARDSAKLILSPACRWK